MAESVHMYDSWHSQLTFERISLESKCSHVDDHPGVQFIVIPIARWSVD
jgi:hypothetical protein